MTKYLHKTRRVMRDVGGCRHETLVTKLTWLGWLYFLPGRIVEALRLT